MKETIIDSDTAKLIPDYLFANSKIQNPNNQLSQSKQTPSPTDEMDKEDLSTSEGILKYVITEFPLK